MDIIIVDNKLYQVCDCDSNDALHIELNNYISEQLQILQIEKSIIRNVIIASIDKSNGRVEIVNTYQLSFDIFINQNIIWYLYDKAQNKYDYASSVIIHELFYCKDLIIANSMIDINDIDKGYKNQTELCINIGFHQWSEYYAHYNSAKVYLSDIVKLACDDKLPKKISDFNKNDLFDYNTITPTDYKYFIHPFIRKIVILLANSNSIKSEAHILELNRYKSMSSQLKDYIARVDDTLTHYLHIYPNCISKNSFLVLGKVLIDL